MVFRAPTPPPQGVAASTAQSNTTTISILPPIPPSALPPIPPPPIARQTPWVLVLPHPKVCSFAALDDNNRMVSADGYPVTTHQPRPLIEAFGSDSSDDSHMVLYSVETDEGPTHGPYPRIAKAAVAALDQLRELDPNGLGKIRRVVGSVLALDFDLPQHTRWTDQYRTQVRALLEAAGRVWPLLARPTVFYTTSGGFRLVWALEQPVDVSGARGLEDLLGGLVAQAYIAGLTVDPACKDWTRLFRLPRVSRADKPPAEAVTWIQSYYAQSWGRVDFQAREATPIPEKWLDGAVPPSGGPVSGVCEPLLHPLSAFRGLSEMTPQEFKTNPQAEELSKRSGWASRIGRPPVDASDVFRRVDVGQCPDDAQIQQSITGGGTQSAAWKFVVNTLKSMAYPKDEKKIVKEAVLSYRIIAEKADIREVDGHKELHTGIGRLVRALCFCFRDRLGTDISDISPQFLHALVIQPARLGNQAHASDGNKSRSEQELSAEVWRLISWHYQHFRGARIIYEEEKAEQEAAHVNFLQENLKQFHAHQEIFINTMVEWSKTKDPVIMEYIKNNWAKMLILSYGQDRYVLKIGNSGELMYSDTPTANWANVLTVGRDCNHPFIEWNTITDKGVRPAEEKEILPKHGTLVKECRLSRLIPRTRVFFSLDGKEVVPSLIEALPGMRSDIVPCYNPLVAEWLTYLGGSNPEVLLQWLSAFPLLECPVPALYIKGESGIGKGMLADALANMTQSRESTPIDQAFARFQGGMFRTPLLHCDERMLEKNPEKHVLDTFKKLISGEFDSLERKGIDQRKVEGHWRVLITANHDDAIPWEKELNKGDKDAFRTRLLHITADSEKASDFLKRMGQWEGTGGWDENEIPRHLAWLMKEREATIDHTKRFLIESKPTEYHENICTFSASTCAVLILLGQILREIQRHPDTVIIHKGDVCVNQPRLDTEMHNLVHMSKRNDRILPKSGKLGQTLKNIALDKNSINIKYKSPNSRFAKVGKFWRLDVRQIIEWLDKNGEDTDFRESLGNELWEKYAPDRVKQMYAEAPAASAAPPPPPPPPATKLPPIPTERKIIQFRRSGA